MSDVIRINFASCVGCRTCEMVCSLSHGGAVDPFHSRIKVVKWEDAVQCVPLNCRQCEAAPCVAVCPTAAIVGDGVGGVVKIRHQRCIGCRSCVDVCPFGAMGFHASQKKVFKCDLCGGQPLCVEFCAYDAIEFVDREALNKDKQVEAARRMLASGAPK